MFYEDNIRSMAERVREVQGSIITDSEDLPMNMSHEIVDIINQIDDIYDELLYAARQAEEASLGNNDNIKSQFMEEYYV